MIFRGRPVVFWRQEDGGAATSPPAAPAEGTVAGSNNGTGDGTAVEEKTPSNGHAELDRLFGEYQKLDPDVRKAFWAKDPDVVKEATRTIRRRDIERKVERTTDDRLGEMEKNLAALKTERDELLTQQEQMKLAGMTPQERERYTLSEQNKLLAGRLEQLTKDVMSADDRRGRASLDDFCRDELDLDESQMGELGKIESAEQYLVEAMKFSATNRRKLVSDIDTKIAPLQAKLDALTRDREGASTTVATIPGATGGSMSFKDLQIKIGTGDYTPEDMAAYRKARTSKGWAS